MESAAPRAPLPDSTGKAKKAPSPTTFAHETSGKVNRCPGWRAPYDKPREARCLGGGFVVVHLFCTCITSDMLMLPALLYILFRRLLIFSMHRTSAKALVMSTLWSVF